MAAFGLAGELAAQELTAGQVVGEALTGQMCSILVRWSDPNVDAVRQRAAMFSGFASGRLGLLRRGGLDTSRLQEPVVRGLLSAQTDDAAKRLLFEQAFRMTWVTVERSGVDPSADSATLRSAAGRLYTIQCAELQAALDRLSRDMKPDR